MVKRINISISENQYNQIRQYAFENKISIAEVIRSAIAAATYLTMVDQNRRKQDLPVAGFSKKRGELNADNYTD